MIHHLNGLSITEKLYESMQPSENDLRFAAIESNLAEYTSNYAAWHWHEYVEFAYVLNGAVDCCTPSRKLTLHAGEGYFVNANVLHMNRIAAGSSTALFRILQFDASLLACAGIIARNYIAPIENAAGLECFAFSGGHSCDILVSMQAAFQAAAAEKDGYEIEIVQLLYKLWRELYLLVKSELYDVSPVTDNLANRIKTMLTFIHTHYADGINVANIAASANISQREAYRSFRQVLGTTPALYLQQYRISTASRLLTETTESITDIALACGFSSPNYFSMAFREQTGKSPRDFRGR